MARPTTDTTTALPSSQSPVIDRFRRWTPEWYRWIKPLLETTRSMAMKLEATDTDLRAAVTTEATARITQDGVLASNITTVSTSVGSLTATVSENTTSINGIEARWGVSIDVNGKVVGLVRLDGSASGSTFTVLADKFVVRQPGTTTDITAFIVGAVNGTTTVGINGNLLVDGTIQARSLSVSTLSAITADIGTVTAGIIRDASDTYELQIANGLFTRKDGTSFLDLKNNIFQFSS